ncbi:SBBP repeat-containing protein [candidate division WOR-3 bacterium]|nr:SBBP repeat-containing protein [candidate division WOR-3 bacterium]
MRVFKFFLIALTVAISAVYPARFPEVVWSRIYDGGGDDEAWDLAVDSRGNVYVTGYSISVTSDYRTVKYDEFGNMDWNKVNDHDDDYDRAFGIDLDNSGNVYVFGRITQPNPDYYCRYHVVKYDAYGSKLTSHSEGNNDEGLDIAVDQHGNIFVTGENRMPSSNSNFWTIKYDEDFNVV